MNYHIETIIDESEKNDFERITREIGVTPEDAVRVFIKAFDRVRGFPFKVDMGSEYSVPVVELPRKNGHTVWPKDLDFVGDDVYAELT